MIFNEKASFFLMAEKNIKVNCLTFTFLLICLFMKLREHQSFGFYGLYLFNKYQ